MKKRFIVLLLSGLVSAGTFAQQNEQTVPLSWRDNTARKEIKTVDFSAPDRESLLKEDDNNVKNGKPFRVGVVLPASVSPENSGQWEITADGSAIWRVQLNTLGAYALSLNFSSFHLPEGALLYLYNEDRSHVIGPLTSEDNPEDGFFSSNLVNGSSLIIEYNQPKNSTGTFGLNATELAYYYRSESVYQPRDEKDFGDAASCEVNVHCTEGSAWQDQVRSVSRLLLKEGNDFFFCSGAMLNNTLQDCTPYLLTAQHCGAGASHSDLRSWKFYFNYEAPGCTDPNSEGSLGNQVVTGCVKMSSSGDVSDVSKSDFMLVVIKNRPVTAYNAYLAGWNKQNTASPSGVGIHHPSGDIKKISTYSTTTTSTTWDGTPNSHWVVKWAGTTNGHGVTEEGSSGSPLFNSSGLVIGDLSGGGSFCNSPNSPDSYGKFSYSWQSCGTSNDKRLSPWLDRNNSGVNTLTGKDNNSCTAATVPTADFEADDTWPIVAQTVTITDLTTNSPFYWQWHISPTTFTYVNGTDGYSQNPQVQFSATGLYTVTLYAVNTAGYAYKNKVSYINVGYLGVEDPEEKPLQVYPNPSAGSFMLSVAPGKFDMEKVVVSVRDLQGKIVYLEQHPPLSGNLLQVNLPSGISNGMYFITLSDEQVRTTERVEIIR